MNQEFIIGPFKIIQDEEGFGVAELVKTKMEGSEEPESRLYTGQRLL